MLWSWNFTHLYILYAGFVEKWSIKMNHCLSSLLPPLKTLTPDFFSSIKNPRNHYGIATSTNSNIFFHSLLHGTLPHTISYKWWTELLLNLFTLFSSSILVTAVISIQKTNAFKTRTFQGIHWSHLTRTLYIYIFYLHTNHFLCFMLSDAHRLHHKTASLKLHENSSKIPYSFRI